jgi:hypothetical protein
MRQNLLSRRSAGLFEMPCVPTFPRATRVHRQRSALIL